MAGRGYVEVEQIPSAGVVDDMLTEAITKKRFRRVLEVSGTSM